MHDVLGIMVIIAIVMVVMNRHHRGYRGADDDRIGGPRLADQQLAPAPRDAELEREVADLRKRLEVLERIATEDRETKRLASEIEALRER